jgi:hypothetical protein
MSLITFKDIYVPSPCNADWDKMNKGDKSRFCINCSKTVYDFTKRNEEDLNKLIREKGGHLCGRFYEDQIDQGLRFQYKKESRIQSFKRFSFSLLSVIALKLLTLSTVLSKEGNPDIVIATIEYPKDYQGSKLPDSSYTIQGKVVDELEGNGISEISVKIYSGKQFLGTTTSDESGIFTLTLAEHLDTDAQIRIETEKKVNKSWRYKTSYKSSETIFFKTESDNIVLKLKIKRKKRIHLKKRRIIMGRFR